MSRIDEKITPFLWFDDQAEQAANFYVSLFDDSEILDVSRYPEGVPGRNAGDAMTVEFRLAGRRFTALNGGPEYRFTEAISLYVRCADQEGWIASGIG
jgi:predicted 3-demethylubiquinone-9 3-methyltransferase (glyoxalase superfamily)